MGHLISQHHAPFFLFSMYKSLAKTTSWVLISGLYLQNKKKAKYEMGNFCEQYGLPPITSSRQKGKRHDKSHKSYIHKKYKNTKTTLLNLMIFMLKRKMFLKNMIHKGQVKVNALIVVNLDILIKTANKNLKS